MSRAPENIYNIEGRYESAVQRLEEDNRVLERDKKLITKFVRDLKLQGLSRSRQLWYVLRLRNLAVPTNKPFDELEKEDVKDLIAWVQDNDDWAYTTKMDHHKAVKRFYKWLEGDGHHYPEKVAWINTTEKHKNRVSPNDLIDEDDFKKLVEGAENAQQRAMLWALWEGGLRIGELLTMRVKDLVFDELGAVAHVDGKTGQRPVRLVASKPALAEHYDNHPTRDPEHALWLNTYGDPMKYSNARYRLNKIKERAGIDKKLHFHLLRKSAATRVAPHLREAVMKNYFGWTQGSRMPAVYVHMSGAAVDQEVLRMYGKVPEDENTNGELKPVECNICGTENTADRDYCRRCRHPISEKGRAEAVEKRMHPKSKEGFKELLQEEEGREMVKELMMEIMQTKQNQGCE